MKSIELTNTEASFLRDGIAAAKSGDKALARSLLLNAIEHDSDNEVGWLWLAYVADNLPEAIEYLRRVLAINPQNEQARANLNKVLLRHGVALAKEGDKSQARALLLEASSLNPDNELVWLWLASVAENSDDALACLRKTIEINPANEQAISWINKLHSQPTTQKADRHCLDCGAVLPEEGDSCPACRTAPTPAVEKQGASEAAEATVAEDQTEEVAELMEQTEIEQGAGVAAEAVVAEDQTEEAAELMEQTEAERANHIVKAGDEDERRREYADSLARRFNRIINAKDEDETARAEAGTHHEEAETHEVEARLRETETRWREEARAEAISEEEAEARAMAEQFRDAAGDPIIEAHAGEVAELRAQVKAEQVKAEPAVRASEEARRRRAEAEARVREAETRLREIEDGWKEKSEARAMAEQRVKDAQEEFKRIVNARREAEMARAEAEAEMRKEAKARASAEQARAEAETQAADAISACEESESGRAEAEARVLKAVARLQEAEAKWRKDTGAQVEAPAAETRFSQAAESEARRSEAAESEARRSEAAESEARRSEAAELEARRSEAAELEAQARVVQTISRTRQPLREENQSPVEQEVQKMGGEMGASLGHTLALHAGAHVGADHVDFKAKARLVSYCLIVILLVTFVWLMTNYY